MVFRPLLRPMLVPVVKRFGELTHPCNVVCELCGSYMLVCRTWMWWGVGWCLKWWYPKLVGPGFQKTWKWSWRILFCIQLKCISISLDSFCLMLLLAIPTAVEFSNWIRVGGWGWCISINVVWIGTAAWPLSNSAPYYASSAKAMMLRNFFHIIKMNPLRMGVYSLNIIAYFLISLIKNSPLDLLLAFVTKRYEASICMKSIIPLAL